MKRTLILAGCLVLGAGCAKKAAPQQKKAEITYTGSALAMFDNVPHLGDYAYASLTSTEADICADKEGHWISCPPTLTFDDGPITIPTMRDVVTHHTELSCPKGYQEWHLSHEARIIGQAVSLIDDDDLVCITPAFIAELKKANGEK